MPATVQTNMRREIDEIPEAVARLLDRLTKDFAATGAALRAEDTAFVVTVACGLSDHAAMSLRAILPVSSIRPSLASIHGIELCFGRGAALPRQPRAQSPRR